MQPVYHNLMKAFSWRVAYMSKGIIVIPIDIGYVGNGTAYNMKLASPVQ